MQDHHRIEDWDTMEDFTAQDIWDTADYTAHLHRLKQRIQQRGDRFIECPTLLR